MPALNFLYQSDENYSKHMGVSILSLLENNKGADILILVIDNGIPFKVKNDICDMVQGYGQRVKWIDAETVRNDTVARNWPEYGGLRKNTRSYLKYFVFDEIFDEELDRVMYIDSDSVVLGPLNDLFTLDMQGKCIGMARCCLVSESYVRTVMGDADGLYFNSGVILFDVRKWHENRYSEKIIDCVKSGHIFGTVDQDQLNIVAKGDVVDIGCQYNFQSPHIAYPYPMYNKCYEPFNYYSPEEVGSAFKNPRIVHFLRFIGDNPWNQNSIHPCAEMYDKYLEMTPWKDDDKALTGNRSIRFRIEKAAYGILPKTIFLKLFRIFHSWMLMRSLSKKRRSRT